MVDVLALPPWSRVGSSLRRAFRYATGVFSWWRTKKNYPSSGHAFQNDGKMKRQTEGKKERRKERETLYPRRYNFTSQTHSFLLHNGAWSVRSKCRVKTGQRSMGKHAADYTHKGPN